MAKLWIEAKPLEVNISSENPYAEAYRTMQQVLQEAEARDAAGGNPVPEIHMRFSNKSSFEKHRYNRPTVHEVAIVFVGEDPFVFSFFQSFPSRSSLDFLMIF